MIKIPILEWLPKYNTSLLKGDVIAGLTAGTLLIPQGMAYAMIAGLEPIYGLYASIVPSILYVIFGTSRQLSVGPVAMVSLLVAAGIGSMAVAGTAEYLALVLTLSFMVGVIQLLVGFFRLGFLVNFLSNPVISGFTSAAALVIGLSQLKHLIGVDLPRSLQIHEILISFFTNIGDIHWWTLVLGVSSLVFIKTLKGISKQIPGALIAVGLGIFFTWFFGLHQMDVKIVGEIPSGLPSFSIPHFEVSNFKPLFLIALTTALVSFMQSIAIAKAMREKHRDYKILPNQELISLGIANIGGAFFQAYPTTGGFSRTAVNEEAGAKTGIASLISTLLIILTLLFFTPIFYYLPNAVLAAVIMLAVFGLIDYHEPKKLWRTDRKDFWMLIATFVGTLILGIELGILIGVVLSICMMIFQTTQPHIAILGKIPNSAFYRNLTRFDCLENREDVLILRFDARLYFGNVNYFKDKIEQYIAMKGENLQLFVLNADSINAIDSSGVKAIEEVIKYCKGANIIFYIAGMKGPVRDVFQRTGLFKKIGEAHFFLRTQNAVDFFDKKEGQDFGQFVLQFEK